MPETSRAGGGTEGLDDHEGPPTNAEAARAADPDPRGVDDPRGTDRDRRTPPAGAGRRGLRGRARRAAEVEAEVDREEGFGAAPGEERQDPDRSEFRRAALGDERAFETLVARHQDRVYTRIYFMVRDRETAADLTQEAFLRCWNGLSSFREECLFTTWLAKVALNVTRHHFERQRAQKRTRREFSIDQPFAGDEDRGGYEIADASLLPEKWALRNERQRAILEAVGALEPEFREALALRELHGLSYQEIGAHLDLPIGTVKSKIFRARQTLQEKLKDLL